MILYSNLDKAMDCRNGTRLKRLLIILLTLFFGQSVFATAQSPDRIIYNGNEYALHSNPLESFFEKNPEKRPEGGIISTGLWRGYIATFEIRDKQLFLKDIEIMLEDTTKSENNRNYIWKSVIDKVFPNQNEIKIDWLTGILVIPQGKLVNYVHMGYASTYENYILLEIDKGDLKNEKHFDAIEYEKFKERQFQAFKKTEEYKKISESLRKEGRSSRKFIDSFLKIYVIEYSSKILTE
jgi:hypothetical protein